MHHLQMHKTTIRAFESLLSKCSRLSSTHPSHIRRLHSRKIMSPSTMSSTSGTAILPRVRLILDWDGTITREDTMSIVFAMGDYTSSTRTRAQLCQDYYDEYKAHSMTYRPAAEDRQTVAQELEWLESLAPIEAASVQRFSDSGAFRRLKARDVARSAKEALDEKSVELSKGWQKIFSETNSQDGRLEMSILTVNWSETFIREVLREAARRLRVSEADVTQKLADDRFFAELKIVGNDFFDLHSEKGSDGRIISAQSPAMQTAASKIKAIRRMREQDDLAMRSGITVRPIYIYVGDSSTDLGALTTPDVDVGIYMRPTAETSLVKVLQRAGIEYEDHVGELRSETVISGIQRNDDGFAKQIYWARNLEDVGELLQRILAKS